MDQKLAIYNLVNEDLSTPYGIKRYLNDSYQSGNFWFYDYGTTEESQSEREKTFIPNSEASWFFNS
ncbi:MAG: hypothetical protein K2M43_01035 [Mycoplasmoidaceae bacterium]|nr:hypothetical protein [Mycoplasmoidaceae bacterium]